MTSFIDAIQNAKYNKWRKAMKILIWVHKSEAISGEVTKHTFTRPYQDRNDEWVQIEITHDEFVRLEDEKYPNDNKDWLVDQHNRNKDTKDWVTSMDQIKK